MKEILKKYDATDHHGWNMMRYGLFPASFFLKIALAVPLITVLLSFQAIAADLKLFDDVLEKIEKEYVEPPEYLFLQRNALRGVMRGADEALTGAEDGEPAANSRDELKRSVGRRIDAMIGRGKDGKSLELAAIRQMVMSLDPHSSIMNPEEYKELFVSTKGEFAGVGMEISADANGIMVVAPIDDSPALDAGIRAGDLIGAIDGRTAKGLSVSDAVKLLRGKAGTTVTLSVERGSKTLQLSLVRRTIRVASVKSRLMDDGFAYVRISSFNEKTHQLLDDALSRFRGSGGGIKGLILDLRNNPGGLLNAAVQCTDSFIDTGLIVSVKGRNTAEHKYEGKTTGTYLVPNMVVLVNKGTASGSEIMAGALQEGAGALVVGQKTFGKGNIQTIYELRDGYGLKLTTARYYLPSGKPVQAGIEPDIAVEDLPGKDAPLLLAQTALKSGKTSARYKNELLDALAVATRGEKGPAPTPQPTGTAGSELSPVPNFGIPENDGNVAVVIGIENYPDIPRSEYSASDAARVADYLKALGFAERNISRLTNEKATYSAIKKTLESWLPNRVRPGGKVVVYFSGHGAPEPKSGEAFIVPYDGDPNYLNDTGYPLPRLYEKLGELKGVETIVLLDSCFSGAGGRSVLARGARPLVMTQSPKPPARANIAILAATQGNQISTSLPDKKQGAFTYFFLKAIKDGKKSVAEIYEYMKPLVEDEARRLNVEQSPSISPDVAKLSGKFFLAQ